MRLVIITEKIQVAKYSFLSRLDRRSAAVRYAAPSRAPPVRAVVRYAVGRYAAGRYLRRRGGRWRTMQFLHLLILKY